MSSVITLAVVAGLAAAFYFIARRSSLFRRAVLRHGFHKEEGCPGYIREVCRELFDGQVTSGPCFRSGADSQWGEDAWIVDVSKGGADDPSQQVFISGKHDRDIPDFAMSLTEGIKKIGVIFKALNQMEKPFSGAGFHLLPESFQPYLQRRKGLAVYAPKEFDIRPLVPPLVLEGLRSGGYGGLACFRGRMVVWTYAQSNPEKLFRIAGAFL